MTLAEKIMKLRKEQGWSQEELAMRLGVSRQSVSKWESMASLPDLDRILRMSELFGVSTDYLLKDEAPAETGCINGSDDHGDGVHTVTLEQANEYLTAAHCCARKFADGISLCILSPVLLILLTVAAAGGQLPWSQTAVSAAGICSLFILVAAAAVLLVTAAMRLSRYAYLEKEPIRTEYGVAGIVEAKREEYGQSFKRLLVGGIVLCIASVLPLALSLAARDESLVGYACVCIFPLVAAGTNLMVRAAFIWSGYQKLLEEGDFTREKKAANKRNEPFVIFYWSFVLAVYLGLSFLTGRWSSTWIIWPVTAVFFAAALALKNMLGKKP